MKLGDKLQRYAKKLDEMNRKEVKIEELQKENVRLRYEKEELMTKINDIK